MHLAFLQVASRVSPSSGLWSICHNHPQNSQAYYLVHNKRDVSEYRAQLHHNVVNRRISNSQLALLLNDVRELLNLVVNLSLRSHQLLNLGLGVHHCRVVPTPEFCPDLGQR